MKHPLLGALPAAGAAAMATMGVAGPQAGLGAVGLAAALGSAAWALLAPRRQPEVPDPHLVRDRTAGAFIGLGAGWQVLDDVVTATGPVDQLIVGPAGVFAAVSCHPGDGWDGRVTEEVALAQRCAQRLQVLLGERGVPVRVRPMVVVWGDRLRFPAGALNVEGVAVLAGEQADAWARHFDVADLDERTRTAVVKVALAGPHRVPREFRRPATVPVGGR